MYPNWNNEEYFAATTRYNILRSDALSASHPMTHHIETPGAIDAMFNNIAYGKCKYRLINSFEEISPQYSHSCSRFTNVCSCIINEYVP